MKAVFIISSLPDILFVWEDNGFAQHINQVLYEAGFIDIQQDMSQLDHSAMAQYFSPMIASLTYMNDVGNPYSSITCKDGTIFVFQQVSAHRTVNVLHCVINLAFKSRQFFIGGIDIITIIIIIIITFTIATIIVHH